MPASLIVGTQRATQMRKAWLVVVPPLPYILVSVSPLVVHLHEGYWVCLAVATGMPLNTWTQGAAVSQCCTVIDLCCKTIFSSNVPEMRSLSGGQFHVNKLVVSTELPLISRIPISVALDPVDSSCGTASKRYGARFVSAMYAVQIPPSQPRAGNVREAAAARVSLFQI